MSRIPAPLLPGEKGDSRQRIIFRRKYLRMKGNMSWGKCSTDDKRKICEKIKYWGRRSAHEFKTGTAKPRKWTKNLPSPPDELSEEIKDNLADYFKIDQKIRLFGYMRGRTFFLIWVSTGHKHTK